MTLDRKYHRCKRKSIISLQMEQKVHELYRNLINTKSKDIKIQHRNLIDNEDLNTTAITMIRELKDN